MQSAIGKALKQQGFVDGERDGRWVCTYTSWQEQESAYFETLVQEEYESYCSLHPDHAAKHGELMILHPVK